MNTNIVSALRLAAPVVMLVLFTDGVSAKNAVPADRAAELLAHYGSVTIKAAGPHVEVGSYAIWVEGKLGRPSAKLPDGTWLYHSYDVKGSDARGTLVVRFNDGRVSGMTLVTPAVAMAMTAPKESPKQVLVASER
jgi:hypothetical protein